MWGGVPKKGVLFSIPKVNLESPHDTGQVGQGRLLKREGISALSGALRTDASKGLGFRVLWPLGLRFRV